METQIISSFVKSDCTVNTLQAFYNQEHYKQENIMMWKNDVTLCKLAFHNPHKDIKDLKLCVQGDFDWLSIHVLKAVDAYDGPYLGYGDKQREIPESNRVKAYDLVSHDQHFSLSENELVSCLIKLETPRTIAASQQEIVLELKQSEQIIDTFTIDLKIIDLEIEDTAFSFELWQYPYSSAEYFNCEPFSQEHFNHLKPMMTRYKDMGGDVITTTIIEDAWAAQTYSENEVHYPSMVKWILTENKMTYDYTDFDKWVSFNHELGLKGKIIVYSMAPWHQSFSYWENDHLVFEAYDVSSKRYETLWLHFLEDFTQHLMNRGWYDEVYIGIDERGFDLKPFELIEKVRNIHAQHLKVAGAMDDFISHYDLSFKVDLLSVGDNAVAANKKAFQRLYNERNKQGLATTLYSCTQHQPGNFLLSEPMESYWSIVNAAKYADGFLRWAYDAWVKEPLLDGTHNAFEPGDTYLIYPYNQSSIRLQKMHEALKDVSKIEMIAQQFPQKVTALFKHLKTDAVIRNTYLDKSEQTALYKELSQFRKELEYLSFYYLEHKKDRKIEISKEELCISNRLKTVNLDEKYISVIEKSPGTERQYLGQPDMLKTSTGRLISAYPQGHGKGPIIMQISDDGGLTWSEYHNKPKSWEGSQETPTLYTLSLQDGSEKLIMISACPGWGVDSNNHRYGFNTSISNDNGNTWSEYKHWYTQVKGKDNPTIVAMASLVHLKDDKGEYIDKWLGVYHDYQYFNYKTYLSFDEQGNEIWSTPELLMPEYREIEKTYQICELGMIRYEKEDLIIAVGRSQSHNNPSVLLTSKDEGNTWSYPKDLPGSLSGERHKLIYDKIEAKLVISFREIIYDLNGNNIFDGHDDWICGDWLVWVGSFEDLLAQKEGDYRIRLKEDFTQSPKKGDTGYAGIEILDDQTLVMHAYGHWDEAFSKQWEHGVTSDLAYIIQARFKLSDIKQ